MTQTLSDGNRVVRTFQRKVYRDGQGRERAEQEPTMAVLGQEVFVSSIVITDPVTGVTYNIDPTKKSAQKVTGVHFSLGISAIARSGDRSAVPVKEQLAPATIEGVYAEGTRVTTTIPAGQIGNEKDLNVVDETWYSPDLQLDVLTRHNDPRTGEAVYKLTKISRSEPDPALFQVPAGYTVTEPPGRGRGGRGGVPGAK